MVYNPRKNIKTSIKYFVYQQIGGGGLKKKTIFFLYKGTVYVQWSLFSE